jgi:hypothetical protein
VQDNATLILGLITGKRVIDFGGFDGPLGFGSIVVDEKAELKTLDSVGGQVDVIFTSHTLEHLEDPQRWLEAAYARLEGNGVLIVLVPSYTCRRWRKGLYANQAQPTGHNHTFALSTDASAQGPNGEWCDKIDSMVSLAEFTIEDARYVGDDSVLVIARKS